MILVGLDIEATGLDKLNDRPIELGLCLWTTNFSRGLEAKSILVQSDGVPITPEITEITGITQGMVDKFGWEPEDAFLEGRDFVDRAEAVVAFNGHRFDIPMMRQWAKRHNLVFPEKLIIDPYEDMPATKAGPTPGMRPQELITMCAKEGIYYDPHEASADVGAMLRLMAKRNFDDVLQRAQSQTVIVQSMQRRNENDKAKKHRFRWNPEKQIWWKAVKRIDLDGLWKLINNEFSIRETGFTPEDMETSE